MQMVTDLLHRPAFGDHPAKAAKLVPLEPHRPENSSSLLDTASDRPSNRLHSSIPRFISLAGRTLHADNQHLVRRAGEDLT